MVNGSEMTMVASGLALTAVKRPLLLEGRVPARPQNFGTAIAVPSEDWAHREVRPPRSNLTLNKFGFGTFLGGDKDVGCLFDVRNDGGSELSTA